MRNVVARKHRSELLDWAVGPEAGSGLEQGISFLAVDKDAGDRRFVASAAGAVECLPAESRQASAESFWRAYVPDLLPDDTLAGSGAALRLVAFAHVPEHEALMLATASGALMLLPVDTDGFGELEEVGAVDAGLLDARWSPDGEILALLTAEGQVVLMSLEWDVLGEVACGLGDLPNVTGTDAAMVAVAGSLDWRGDGQFLAANVEWSKPSPGRSISVVRADPCELFSTAEGLKDLSGPIAWQPNGRHLYCVCGTPEGRSRAVLLEANGLQHGGFDLVLSTGEDGDDTALSSQECQTSASCCTDLAWSADSEMLAAVLSASGGAGSSPAAGCTLQVWRRSNWRWDLKHEMHFPFAKALGIRWDAEQGGCIRAFTACGELHTLHYDLQPCVSALGTAAVIDGTRLRLTPLRQCVVPPPLCAVTLRYPAAVQCAALLACGQAEGQEAAAAVLADGTLAVAWSVEADLWEETAEEAEEDEVEEDEGLSMRAPRIELDSPAGLSGRLVRHLAWTGPLGLLVVASSLPGEPGAAGDVLIPIELAEAPDCCKGAVGQEIPAGGQVLAVAQGGQGAVFLQIEGQGTSRFQPGLDRLVAVPPPAGLPADCRWISAVPKDDGGSGPKAQVSAAVVGLTDSGALYWGGALLAPGITSAAVHGWGPGGAFVLFTTRDHMMHTLTLSQADARANGSRRGPITGAVAGRQQDTPTLTFHPGSRGAREAPVGMRRDGEANHYSDMHDAMRPTGKAAADCTVRRIEAGGMLVASQPGSYTAVLQMPRGNLEVVEPRHLVLTAVTSSLRALDYGSAWRIARETRLDLNIIVDYRWPMFLEHAREFVQAVKKEADICDLMAALTASSTLQAGGEYEAVLAFSGLDANPVVNELGFPGIGDAQPSSLNKVAAVCCAIREALIADDEQGYTIAILTSHARHDPPELGKALQRIKKLREDEVTLRDGGGAAAPIPVGIASEDVEDEEADQATAAAPEDRQSRAVAGLRSLLLYLSPQVLYRAALALYDIPLAYLVIDTTGLDPGDYLGELQLWLSMEPPAARYAAIDRHLGNWAGALGHLAGIEGDASFEEALALARGKGLLRLALSLYKAQPAYHNRVLTAIAESLSGRGKHEDAAVAWLAAGDKRQALESYVEAGEWRQAMALGNSLQLERDEIQAMARNLAEEMRGSMGPADAAVLYLDYLEDVDGAVVLFTQAQDWREATRAAQRFDRADLVKTVIVPAAAATAASMLRDTRENTERVAKYLARLKEVRTKRIALNAVIEADGGGLQPEGEDGDAESLVSGMSAYTVASTAAGTGIGSSLSSAGTPSTVGGRRAAGNPRKKGKQRKKGSGIRQGTIGEEHGLITHLKGLQPTPQELAHAGHLCELLILHGHLDDAAQIQAAVTLLVSAAADAYQEAASNPPPPLSDENTGASSGGMAVSSALAWKWDILREPEATVTAGNANQ